MGLDPVRALIPTQRLGVDVTFTGKLPAPAARAGKADPEAFGRLMPGRAGLFGPGVRCVGSTLKRAGCSVQVLQTNS